VALAWELPRGLPGGPSSLHTEPSASGLSLLWVPRVLLLPGVSLLCANSLRSQGPGLLASFTHQIGRFLKLHRLQPLTPI